MVVSSSALFHFTRNADNLISILTHEFKPKYCLENFANLFHDSKGDWELAIPMTCFCDLPLSNIKDHIDFYGEYGIGMRKEWGLAKGINPVHYLHPSSSVSFYITNIMKYMSSVDGSNPGFGAAIHSFVELLGFIKLYEGRVLRKGMTVQKRFYDEREWRYVPLIEGPVDRNNVKHRLSKEEFLNDVVRAEANSRLSKHISLSFDPDDIKYIIVSKEDEIPPMIEAIERIKEKYDPMTVKVLSSKILTSDQIRNDF